jgi:hypothetical protein
VRVPKPKSRVVKSANLRSLDGVRDVSFGSASVDGRMMNDFKKGGSAAQDKEYDDDKARNERWGFPI